MSHSNNNIMPAHLRKRLQLKTRAERESIERVWHLLEEAGPPAGAMPNADEMWAELERRASTRSRADALLPGRIADARPARARSRSTLASTSWLAAAVLSIAVCLGAFIWWNQPVSITAPPGDRTTVSLPDGSSVELAGGSSVSYQRGFSHFVLIPTQQRTATVEGEAYFDVSAVDRPFVVETFNARIQVLGTRFSVQAWSGIDHPETRVTLASGLVRVASRTLAGEDVVLQEAGHTSRIVGSASAPTRPHVHDIDQVLAWRQQGFHASDQPLSAILARLESHFGTEIILKAQSAAADPMTLYYSQMVDLETILHDICMAKGLKYRRTSRGYEIVENRSAGDGNHT